MFSTSEEQMHWPLIRVLNHVLCLLAEIEVPGPPNFEEDRQIVFARGDAERIESESYLRDRYKPDIVLLRRERLNQTRRGENATTLAILPWNQLG